VNSGRSIWHCSHDWHLVALAACGRGDLLLDEACRHRGRDGDDQRVGANFGSDLLQHSATVCGFIVSKTMSAPLTGTGKLGGILCGQSKQGLLCPIESRDCKACEESSRDRESGLP